MTVVQLKLLLSGDVELNPGPPKRGAPKGAPPKEKEAPPPQDNNIGALETKVYFLIFNFDNFKQILLQFANAGMYKALSLKLIEWILPFQFKNPNLILGRKWSIGKNSE